MNENRHLGAERETLKAKNEKYMSELIIWSIEMFPSWTWGWAPDSSILASKTKCPAKIEHIRVFYIGLYDAEFCGLSKNVHSFHIHGVVME